MRGDLHEVELIPMVDAKLGQSSVWVQTKLALKRRDGGKLIKLNQSVLGLYRAHLVRIDIMEDRLSLARILNKTLHRVSDKGVGEHVRDVEEVLGDDVGGAPEVKVRQLICLRGQC